MQRLKYCCYTWSLAVLQWALNGQINETEFFQGKQQQVKKAK